MPIIHKAEQCVNVDLINQRSNELMTNLCLINLEIL